MYVNASLPVLKSTPQNKLSPPQSPALRFASAAALADRVSIARRPSVTPESERLLALGQSDIGVFAQAFAELPLSESRKSKLSQALAQYRDHQPTSKAALLAFIQEEPLESPLWEAKLIKETVDEGYFAKASLLTTFLHEPDIVEAFIEKGLRFENATKSGSWYPLSVADAGHLEKLMEHGLNPAKRAVYNRMSLLEAVAGRHPDRDVRRLVLTFAHALTPTEKNREVTVFRGAQATPRAYFPEQNTAPLEQGSHASMFSDAGERQAERIKAKILLCNRQSPPESILPSTWSCASWLFLIQNKERHGRVPLQNPASPRGQELSRLLEQLNTVIYNVIPTNTLSFNDAAHNAQHLRQQWDPALYPKPEQKQRAQDYLAAMGTEQGLSRSKAIQLVNAWNAGKLQP